MIKKIYKKEYLNWNVANKKKIPAYITSLLTTHFLISLGVRKEFGIV